MKIKRIHKGVSAEARVEISYKLKKRGRENAQKRLRGIKKAEQAREKIIRLHENRNLRYLDYNPDYPCDDFRSQF